MLIGQKGGKGMGFTDAGVHFGKLSSITYIHSPVAMPDKLVCILFLCMSANALVIQGFGQRKTIRRKDKESDSEILNYELSDG